MLKTQAKQVDLRLKSKEFAEDLERDLDLISASNKLPSVLQQMLRLNRSDFDASRSERTA
jgi:hypothetical protein